MTAKVYEQVTYEVYCSDCADGWEVESRRMADESAREHNAEYHSDKDAP